MLRFLCACYDDGPSVAVGLVPIDPLFFVVLALALGFKHSYDADHLVAVSNLLTRSRDIRKTAWMSISWALGHMVTAAIITILLYEFRAIVLQEFLRALELAVAVMLVVLGVFGLLVEFGYVRLRTHVHPSSEQHVHTHFSLPGERVHHTMFGIGVVHGLASNDELLTLLLASLSVASLATLLGGVGVFSAGVVIGMILFGLAVSYPTSRWGTARVRRVVNVVAAALSIGYAIYLILGFEGLNLLPLSAS